MACEHDKRFGGVFFLPKADNGCLACALEHAIAKNKSLAHQRNSYRHELETYNPKLVAKLDEAYKE